MRQFFVEETQIHKPYIDIVGTDVNHIQQVLRLKKGENIQIISKQTHKQYVVEIIQYEEQKIITQIIQEVEETAQSNIQIDIYQGIPKSDKMEWIIQKTTELGVNAIIPTIMERCIVKLNEKDAKKKIERWQKIAEGAAKQSKRINIPSIEPVIKLPEVIEKMAEYDVFIVAYEEENKQTLKNVLQNIAKTNKPLKIGIIVGPEGGIDKKEIVQLQQTNAKIVTLGKRILRTETAPIVITANIMYELENEE